MSRSGRPLVVDRASSGWCASPRQANAHVSVLPKHEISVALGSRSCIETSDGGTPTAITSRIRLRSAVAKARVVEHAEPDRLEGGEGDGAALLLELVERGRRLEVGHLERGAGGDERARQDRDAADVEERQGRPEAVVRRQAEPLRDPLALRHDRGVAVDAALRVGGGARRVEHQPVVVPADLGLRGGDGRGIDGGGVRRRTSRRPCRPRPGRSPRRRPPRAASAYAGSVIRIFIPE